RLPKTWERSAAFCLVQPELWVYRRMRFHINKHPPRRHLTTEDQEAGLIQRWPSPLTTRAELGRSEERRVGKECRDREEKTQAEDGIRDRNVTGVQTCALPISVAENVGKECGVLPRAA